MSPGGGDGEIPRVVFAADRSSAGKTTVCIGIMALLREMGFTVQGFKVALDYIDTGFHSIITGRASRNLDGFLMSPADILKIFARACEGADIAVIEGVRGLYEGLNYDDDVGSTAQISKILGAPVILIVDARSLTRSAAALVSGYMNFDEVEIAAVILNYIGTERHGEKAEKAIERYCGIDVIGKIPEDRHLKIGMRHLGLITAVECMKRMSDFNAVIERIKRVIGENVDVDAVVDIARRARNISIPADVTLPCSVELPIVSSSLSSSLSSSPSSSPAARASHSSSTSHTAASSASLSPALSSASVSSTAPVSQSHSEREERVKIAVAYDEAFNFYYQDTLDMLACEGAEILFFSPIYDRQLPEGIDAIYIGGGFPEIYAEDLQSNEDMRASVREYYENDGVIYAECGGLMYLMDELEYESKRYEMCGVIRGRAEWTDERRIVNYVVGEIRRDCFLGKAGKRFKAHEFHRSKIMLRDESTDFAYRIFRGEGIIRVREKDAVVGLDGIITKNCIASYTHIHAVAFPRFAEDFVGFLRQMQ